MLGKTSTLGLHEGFDKGSNVLKEALKYFFSKATDETEAM